MLLIVGGVMYQDKRINAIYTIANRYMFLYTMTDNN